MTDGSAGQAPGWYYAQGDPAGTHRYWDGGQWQGGPQAIEAAGATGVAGASDNLAEGGQRIGARLIDAILIFIINAIVATVVVGSALAVSAGGDVSYIKVAIATLFTAAIAAAYEILMVARNGQTVGKMALGIKVVKQDGSELTTQDSFMRYAVWLAISLAGLIPIIGFLGSIASLVLAIWGLVVVLGEAPRQTFWDQLGKTIVVKAK